MKNKKKAENLVLEDFENEFFYKRSKSNLNITFKTGSRHDGQFKGITNYSVNLLHQQIIHHH